MSSRLLVFTAILASAAALMPSRPAAAQQTEAVVLRSGDPIVVRGERPIEADEVREAVRDLAMRGREFTRPMPQFQAPLCLKVAGLGEAYDAAAAQRIEANIVDAGLKLAGPDCETNAVVLVVRDPHRLIRRMRQDRPMLFNVNASRRIKAARNRGDAAIAWRLTRLGGPRGGALPQAEGVAGAVGTNLFANAGANVPQTVRLGTTKFVIPYSVEAAFAAVVFDLDRLHNVHLDQLADFATMRLLADPQPEIELQPDRAASILNLFDVDPLEGPQRMTRLDRAFLRGLYAMRPNSPATRLEQFVLAAYENMGDTAETPAQTTPGPADIAPDQPQEIDAVPLRIDPATKAQLGQGESRFADIFIANDAARSRLSPTVGQELVDWLGDDRNFDRQIEKRCKPDRAWVHHGDGGAPIRDQDGHRSRLHRCAPL